MPKRLESKPKRPECRWCGIAMKPYAYFRDPIIDPEGKKQWGYEGCGVYCSLRCGYKDALALVKKHYREGTP